MTPSLFGTETEYGVAADNWMDREIRQVSLNRIDAIAAREVVHLPARQNGSFWGNGSRFYRESAGDGSHPELAVPEVSHPTDAVIYTLAGDQLMSDFAAKAMREDRRIQNLRIFKTNVDYVSRCTFGNHESYFTRRDPRALAQGLLGHLVSRVIFTGAGGFNPGHPGIEFLISPRSLYIVEVLGGSSTDSRPIIHLRDEPLCDAAGHRTHLICGEGVCSQRQHWLRIATTSLVMHLLDGGVAPGREVCFGNPVDALHRIASDSTLGAGCLCEDGATRTALEVQRHYLRLVEQHASARFMPPWTAEAIPVWKAMLELLARGPDAVARTLDWGIKYFAVFTRHLRARGFTWERVGQINRRLRSALVESPFDPDDESQPERLPRGVLRDSEFADFFKLRAELCELDVRYSQLDARGLFRQLDAAGVLAHRMPGVTPEVVSAATTNPPRGGRAEARGRFVQKFGGTGNPNRYSVDWDVIYDSARQRIMELDDPFSATLPAWRHAASRGETARFPRAAQVAIEIPSDDEDGGVRLFAKARERYFLGQFESAAQFLLSAEAHVADEAAGFPREFFRYSAWIHSRRGQTGGLDILRRGWERRTPTMTDMVDALCVLRFEGLAPTAEMDEWIRVTERMTERTRATHADLAEFYEVKAFHLMRKGLAGEAHESAGKAVSEARGAGVPRVLGRALAVLGDAEISLDRIEGARTHIEEADSVFKRCGAPGERADFASTVMGKLPGPDALASLAAAIDYQRQRSHSWLAMARTSLLLARVARQGARVEIARTSVINLSTRLPVLARCPRLVHVLEHWGKWIAGESDPGGHPDAKFWGI